MISVVNVNLGEPYNVVIRGIIERGYAGNQTEVLRQAVLALQRELDEREEVLLVNKGIESEMREVKRGKSKLLTFAQLKARLKK